MNVEFICRKETLYNIEMKYPPRTGESVVFDGVLYRVVDVCWAPRSELGGSAVVYLIDLKEQTKSRKSIKKIQK